jgi:putative DNA primase/helicase
MTNPDYLNLLDHDLLRQERESRLGSNGAANDEWPQPQPLPGGLPAVPPFDAALLPALFRAWVTDVSERMQCPPDFAAVAMMIAADSLIGRQLSIRPKQKDDWTVVPNLWGMIIGRPSLLKSPALHEAMRPLRALEAEAAKRYREAMGDWEAGQVVAKEAAKVAAPRIRKLLKMGQHAEARAHARQDLESEQEPVRRRFVVNDTTVEKLGVILAENPIGVLIFRDELVGFLRAMEREGHEQDRAFYLEA